MFRLLKNTNFGNFVYFYVSLYFLGFTTVDFTVFGNVLFGNFVLVVGNVYFVLLLVTFNFLGFTTGYELLVAGNVLFRNFVLLVVLLLLQN